MRDYGKLFSKFWTQQDIRALSDHGKLLAAYLLTGPHTTMIGCFRLPVMYVCADLGWTPERADASFAELISAKFVTLDRAEEWVLINKFLKYNPLENPNQGTAALKLVNEVPRLSAVWSPLVDALSEHGGKFIPLATGGIVSGPNGTVGKPSGNGSETVGKPSGNQEQEQEQEQDTGKACTAASAAPDSPTVLTLTLNDGTEYPVTQYHVSEFRQLYPAVDVPQALRDMRGWLLGNPRNRKTSQGVARFVHSWLKREQDKAPVVHAPVERTPEPQQKPKPSIELPADMDVDAGRKAWAQMLTALKRVINQHSFETWLKPLRAVGVSKATLRLYVRVPTIEFIHLEEKYGEQINTAAQALGLSGIKLFFEAQ